jgi:hypothetical protein
LHIALVFGLLLFWVLTTFGTLLNLQVDNGSLKITLQFLVPLAIIACITGSQMLYNAKIYSIQKEMEMNKKTDIYRQAFVIKCALLEAPAILSLIALLLTGDKLFSLLAAGMIAYLIVQYPSKQKIIDTLPLTNTEIKYLSNKE